MSSQLIVQWNYIIQFHVLGPFLTAFLTSFFFFYEPVFGKECICSCKLLCRNCKSARFVCFYRWLRKFQNIYPLIKFYCIIERVYFIHRLFILFIGTFSFLLFLYSVSWRQKRDYLHASIDILFEIMFHITNTMKKQQTLLYRLRTYDTTKVPI